MQQGPYKFTHTYTDSKPAHTILLYGRENTITKLDCSRQEVIFLDVTADSSLIELECSKNRLTTLDVSKNRKLEYFHCSYNRLSDLNTANNPNLTYLAYHQNYLSTIDISANTKVEELNCVCVPSTVIRPITETEPSDFTAVFLDKRLSKMCSS